MSESRQTSIRFVVIAVSMMMSIKLYLDRLSISSMQPYITEEFGLSKFQVASVLGFGFFLSYALAQVPAGWLGDRFGPRAMLAAFILVWSLFTGLTGLALGFLLLLVARLGTGLGQAGAYPACGTLLSKWVPLSSRATASSLVALGGRIGAFVAPILTSILIVMFVPLSTPVEIADEQLLNASRICSVLTESAAQPREGKHLAAMLPESLRSSVAQAGGEYREWDTGRKKLEAKGALEVPSAPQVDAATRAALLTWLNGLLDDTRLHDDRWLSKRDHPFARLSIEREADLAMRRLEAGQQLEAAERRRLNRMILEAALPGIRKLYVAGWRPVFWLYGIGGIAVAGVFWFLFRDHPRQHPWCNAEEIEIIEAGKPDTPPKAAGIPWGPLVASRSLWASSLLQIGTNIGWLLVVTYTPQYLIDVYNVPLAQRSQMTAIPPLGGIVGMYMGGWLTDVLTRRLGLRWGRALPMALTRFGAGAAYLVCMRATDPWVATAALTVMFFFCDLGVSAIWAFCQDVGGRNVGSVLGWGNMWGNVGAALAPFIYAQFLGNSPGAAEWNRAFTVCAIAFAASGVAAFFIDSTKPVERRVDDAPRMV